MVYTKKPLVTAGGKSLKKGSLVDWIRSTANALAETMDLCQAGEVKWVPPVLEGNQPNLWSLILAEAPANVPLEKKSPGWLTIGRGYDLLCALFRLLRAELIPADGESAAFAEKVSQSLYNALRIHQFIPKTVPWPNRKGRQKVRGLVPGRVLRVKVRLLAVTPKTWREFLVADCSLDCLSAHIQAAMGWTGHQNYQFIQDKNVFKDLDWYDYGHSCLDWRDFNKGNWDPLKPQPLLDAKRYALSSYLEKPAPDGFVLRYCYESGDKDDPWLHDVTLWPHRDSPGDEVLPVCTGGRMACPLEEGILGPLDFMHFKGGLVSQCAVEKEENTTWLERVRPLHDFSRFDKDVATENMRRVHRG